MEKTGEAKWIVVSGLDGSGKTTLCTDLQHWFEEEKNLRVMRSRLPFDEYLVKNLLNESSNSYTDRMIFALDNRLFAEKYRAWSKSREFDIILTQRGFLDSYVHGAVQGYSYSWISEFNHIADLPKCQVIIHFVAEAETAYQRIKDDPDADKFEYLAYIRRQEQETRRAYRAVCDHDVDMAHFKDCINIYVDTTQLSTEETFQLVKRRLIEFGVIQ